MNVIGKGFFLQWFITYLKIKFSANELSLVDFSKHRTNGLYVYANIITVYIINLEITKSLCSNEPY